MAEKESQKSNINSEDVIAEFARRRREGRNKKGKSKASSGETAGNEGESGDAISDFARRRRRAREVLRKQSTEGFSFLKNGNIGGAVGLALAGLLSTNSVKWGENWKDYGKKEFYSWKGMKGKGSEIRKAFAGIGKG